ncbi:MAG: dockerin type I domain-containing protein [Clostridiales bacterium]|jgi:hypothetical protein|nr:dockerin type I domain-containing protein [Clostridiales bacterium]
MQKKVLRRLSFFLVLVMVLSLLPLNSLATTALAADPKLDLDAIVAANSPELAYLAACAKGEASGFDPTGKFLAPISDPDPGAIKIYTAADLNNVRNKLDGSFVLMNDIDLTGWGEWRPLGNSLDGDPFTGTFDGQGHEIKNLTISSGGYDYAGLFAYAENAVIKNVGLNNASINASSAYYAGGICGYLEDYDESYVFNCYNTGNINAVMYAGGILGFAGISTGNISYCYNTGDIASENSAGGICGYGYVYEGYISHCYNSGNISNDNNSGGIFGYGSINDGYISHCYNRGAISSDYSSGGIFGNGDIYMGYASHCYNAGSITSASIDSKGSAGGFFGCGHIQGSNISYCYNSGDISSSSTYLTCAGGLFAYGFVYEGYISHCYNFGDVAAPTLASEDYDTAYAGGICGQIYAESIFICYNSGAVSVASAAGSGCIYSGGICGFSDLSEDGSGISNCYNIGAISAKGADFDTGGIYAGGICGRNQSYQGDAISYCYNSGDVITSGSSAEYEFDCGGIYAGGICGNSYVQDGNAIVNCLVLSDLIYAEKAARTVIFQCSLIGNIEPSGNGDDSCKFDNLALMGISGNAADDSDSRITLLEAKDQATYEGLGWNFGRIWEMIPGFDFPQFKQTEIKPFTVQVVNSNRSGLKFNGQNTLVSSFQVRANQEDMTLKNVQGLRLAYDNTVLQLIKWDASAAIPEPAAGGGFGYAAAGAENAGVLGDAFTVYNAISSDSKTGYLSLAAGDPNASFACSADDFATLGEWRFAFREGKSIDDLRDDSIRVMATAELYDLRQIYAVLLNTDDGLSYTYGTQVDGIAQPGLDNLAEPGIIWNLSFGVAVSGKIRSYNPKNSITVYLRQDGVDAYNTTIAAPGGWGQVEQGFRFEGVDPGKYDLVIVKDIHTTFTVRNLVVGDKDLDLTQNSRPEVRLMNLRCGDINGDGLINDADLTILWRVGNYNRRVDEADDPRCDLNGDGLINDADLTILWLTYNYNRGPVVIE